MLSFGRGYEMGSFALKDELDVLECLHRNKGLMDALYKFREP